MIGKTISHYKILEKLGEGGMGVVYKAEDTKLERTVALKFLSLASIGEEEKKRFKREAKAAASLNHPNIATIYAIEEVDDETFIVMEYIKGQSLQEIVGANGGKPMPIDKALDYATQTAAGLQAAHEKGITHRDIKSANIMVTDKGQIKIMDFGLAKLANRSKLTQLGTTLGTAAYMSPEQSRGENTDHRADIWSLGVVLYEMISGQMPFKGDYEQAVIYSIQNEDPEPLTALRSGVPIALDGIIAKTLAKDADTRYQNVEELPADLKGLDSQHKSVSRVSTMTTASLGVQPTKQQRKWIWILAGLLTLATTVAIWGWLRPPILNTTSTANNVVRFSIDLPSDLRFHQALTREAAISPDGKTIAYTAIAKVNSLLYVRQLETFETRILEGTEMAKNPFFSPDGKWIGFFVDNGKLKKIPTAGGAVLPLCDVSYGTGASWGPDNTIVFAPSYNSGLLQISADGNELREVSKLDSSNKESSHGWPQFLPGGEAIIFTIEKDGETFDKASIVAQVLETGQRKVLIEGGTFAQYVPTGHLLYARSNTLLAVSFNPERMEVSGSPVQVLSGVLYNEGRGTSQFAVADNGALLYLPGGDALRRSELVVTDRTGTSRQLIQNKADYKEPRISPDGQFVVTAIGSSNDDIWLTNIERETQTRLTFKAENKAPTWLSDGSKIVFSSDRTGILKQLTAGGLEKEAPDCSPDGRFLVFDQHNPQTGWDLWLLPLTGDDQPRPFRQTRFNESGAAYSPDGNWLAYVSDESGQNEVYVEAADGSGKRFPASVGGGGLPVWSPKGNELFYANDGKMMVIKISMGRQIIAGRPKELFQLPPFRDFDIMPDGDHFVVTKLETKTRFSRINVVLNWFEELQSKMKEGRR